MPRKYLPFRLAVLLCRDTAPLIPRYTNTVSAVNRDQSGRGDHTSRGRDIRRGDLFFTRHKSRQRKDLAVFLENFLEIF